MLWPQCGLTRILLDENLDWRLAHSMPGHAVESVQKNSWAGLRTASCWREPRGGAEIPRS